MLRASIHRETKTRLSIAHPCCSASSPPTNAGVALLVARTIGRLTWQSFFEDESLTRLLNNLYNCLRVDPRVDIWRLAASLPAGREVPDRRHPNFRGL